MQAALIRKRLQRNHSTHTKSQSTSLFVKEVEEDEEPTETIFKEVEEDVKKNCSGVSPLEIIHATIKCSQ